MSEAEPDIGQAVRRYYMTVDTAGPAQTVALFTDEAVYRRPGYEPMRGRGALDEFYTSQRVIAGGRHTIDSVVIDGPNAAVQGRFHGVLRDGGEVAVGFADFMEFEGDLIADRTTYFYKPAV